MAGALRIGSDARIFSECWFGRPASSAIERFQPSLENIRIVFGKLQIFLAQFEALMQSASGLLVRHPAGA